MSKKRPDPRKYRPVWGGHLKPAKRRWGCLPVIALFTLAGLGFWLFSAENHNQGQTMTSDQKPRPATTFFGITQIPLDEWRDLVRRHKTAREKPAPDEPAKTTKLWEPDSR